MREAMVRPLAAFAAAASILLAGCARAETEEALIRVDCGRSEGEVNPLVFGNNFLGYDPMTYEDWAGAYYGYSDYGAGMWDPVQGKPSAEVMALAREAGITVARFPGGCGTHHYDWKKAIGRGRKHFLYGIDEFMKTCEETGAQAVITLSYFEGDERDAADLVEYLNSACDGSNPNGGIDWAKQRAANGHAQPYGVKYFEFGNEEWHGDHRAVKETRPADYAKRYLRYRSEMKAVDPGIQLGVILYIPEWDRPVMDIVKDKVDFGIVHPYPSARVDDWLVERIPGRQLFRMALARVVTVDEEYLKSTGRFLSEKAGRPVPLAVTEYNAGFVQENPVAYRHTLGAALINADFLRIMMKPRNHVLLATQWQFCNSYWGMVFTPGDFMTPDPGGYIKRPSFYVYELYAQHFGDRLLPAQVQCGNFSLQADTPIYDLGQGVARLPDSTPIPLLSVNASKKEKTGTVYLMVVNKSMDQDIRCRVSLDGFSGTPSAVARVLDGPSIESVNEPGKEPVGIKQSGVFFNGGSCEMTFPAHSFTALEVNNG